jgi:uncharacterized protein
MKYHYQRSKQKKLPVIVLFLIGILIGSLATYYYFTTYYYKEVPQSPLQTYTPVSEPASYSVEINLVAVDQDGNGVSTPLIVESKPGSGKALTNIDKLLFWTDTQQSIQIAKYVAENITNINASSYDLTYSIESNATVIGGPSAGAALTIATVAALRHEKIRNDVIITGTVNEDGTIGEIGGVLEKAKAAKEIGAKIFLVPEGQGEQTFLKPQESCSRRGNFLFCQTTYQSVTINISEDAGISVIEVGTVADAYKYFKL